MKQDAPPPLTRDQLSMTIAIGVALIALGLIGGFIGGDAASLAGVVIGLVMIGWAVWQRRSISA